MKLFSCTLALILLFAFHQTKNYTNREDARQILAEKKLSAIRCTPDWATFKLNENAAQQMIPLPGTGKHYWKISTAVDSAQYYFNQGINLYYGFHIIEAIPSFKKAQLFDPSCAMLYWGEALAYGPNINDLGYSASPEALSAIEKAKQLSNKATAKEKTLILAAGERYSMDTHKREKH